MNIQTSGSTNYLPAQMDVALTANYKLNDKSGVGAGVSYRLGLGNGWNHIQLTNEGAGFRVFSDYKAQGSIWVTGGAELNYMQSFRKLEELSHNVAAWRKSALLGITKKIRRGSKENSIQLLYDFLYAQHVPENPPLVFRVGFKL